MRTDDATVAGALFVALPALFTTTLMLAAAMAPDYDVGAAAISELGVIPETALLFNAAMVATGVGNAAAGRYFYRVHGRRWLVALFVVAGVGTAGVGVFPMDTGAPHAVAAFVAFSAFNLQALGTATWLDGAMRAFAVVAGVVGLLALGWFVLGGGEGSAAYAPFGYGGVERLIVYPGLLWSVALGGYLLAPGQS
ncbi:MAG: DUF998 domain-containing protein [Halobacteriaceae archaeon]